MAALRRRRGPAHHRRHRHRPANPAVLADTGKARHLSTLLRRTVAVGVPTATGLDAQFPGNHTISMIFHDHDHDRFVDVDVPVMDALGNDDGVLTVAVTYTCTTHPPHSQHADEQAARRAVEHTTTLLTTSTPAAAVATPCRGKMPERSWTTRHTPPAADTAAAVRASSVPGTGVFTGEVFQPLCWRQWR